MSGNLKRLITIAFLVAGCSSGSGGPPPLTASPTERPAATLPSDALSQMELAFVGSPRKSEIKAILDQALSLYGLELTQDNYSRAGSALIAVRIDAEGRGCGSCTERAILERMLRDGKLAGLDFAVAVGWTVAAIEIE